MSHDRPQKITLADMRAANVRDLLIYCSDYHCSYWTAIGGDPWPDDVRLSDAIYLPGPPRGLGFLTGCFNAG